MENTPNPAPTVHAGEAVLAALHWRYATKVFDATKKLTQTQWEMLQEALVLTPSSFGLQPWRFINVVDPALRAQLRPASWGQSQITDASHLVVFAAKEKVTEADVDKLIQATAQARGVPAAGLDGYKQMMLGNLVTGPRAAMAFEWAARQCYIALGNLMTSAAMIGVDTCPMEGLDPAAYDKILGLEGSGYRTVCACPVGFRATADKYAGAKKVRYPAGEVWVRR